MKNREIIIDDKIIEALETKVSFDAVKKVLPQTDDFDLKSLHGLSFEQALQEHPRLVEIMNETVERVSCALLDDLQNFGEFSDDENHPEALEVDYKDAALLKKLGQAFYNSGYFNKAIKAFDTVLKLFPQDAEIHMMVADLYFKSEHHDEAIEHYEAALPFLLEPEQKRVRSKLAHIHVELAEILVDDDQQKAFHFYEKALGFVSSYIPALCGLGRLSFLQKNYHNAQVYFEWVLDIDPSRVEAITGLGDVHLVLDDHKKAESLYDEATVRNPLYVPGLHAMAHMQFRYRSSPMLALNYCETIFRLEPNHIGNLLLVAEIFIALKNFEEAEKAVEKLFDLDPGNRKAFDMYCRLKNGEYFMSNKDVTLAKNPMLRTVNPDRREMSRDFYYGLFYEADHHEDVINDYVAEVVRDKKDVKIDKTNLN